MPIESDEELSKRIATGYLTPQELGAQFLDPPVVYGERYSSYSLEGYAPTRPAWPRDGVLDRIPHPQSPTIVYFYCISFSGRMRLSFKIFRYGEMDGPPIILEDMKDIVQDMINDPGNYRSWTNPGDVVWEGPSYLAFLIEHDNWTWHYIQDDQDPAKRWNNSLHFAAVDDPKTGQPIYHANRSFFNANEFEVTLLETTPARQSTKRYVLYCENHNTLFDGSRSRTRRDSDDPYKVDLYFRVAVDQSGGKLETIIIDPSGKNTGPRCHLIV